MEIITNSREMMDISDRVRASGRLIGFVPTMGYLHKGHLTLVDEIKEQTDVVVLSIFVNPLQFGATEDFATYPRDFEHDKKLAEHAEVDYIFYPSSNDLLPTDRRTGVYVSELTQYLCGKSRPGHFDGVTTIVSKLLNIIKPHVVAFGEKDRQQLIIIKQMIQDLNFDVEVLPVPIVREVDGLAMSSRNSKLSDEHRLQAPGIFIALNFGKNMIVTGEVVSERVKEMIIEKITTGTEATIDYVEIVSQKTLEPVETLTPKSEVLIAVAVKYGQVRLIDNLLVTL